jgi:hypothetical protein
VRDFPTRPHCKICLILWAVSGRFWRRLLSPRPLMNDLPKHTAGLPDHADSGDDDALFAFTNTLRLSVRAKVVAEQSRGLSLSEIVVQVREMVRLAEEDARHPRRFPSRAFRAISRQAVAWCVESYRPVVFAAGVDRSTPHRARAPEPMASVVAPVGDAPPVRFPAMTPTYRGLP